MYVDFIGLLRTNIRFYGCTNEICIGNVCKRVFAKIHFKQILPIFSGKVREYLKITEELQYDRIFSF